MADRRVSFHRAWPPYEPGDVAGFSPVHARRLVDRGVASYLDSETPPDFGRMNRAELVRYAVEVLGFDDEPPSEVTDDELRAALVAQSGTVEGEAEDVEPPTPAPAPVPPASGKAAA